MLGRDVTATVYDGYLRSDSMTGFVWLRNQRVDGFVVGSAAPASMRRQALRLNLWPIAIHVAVSVALRPRRLGPLFDGVRRIRNDSVEAGGAELTYIGVSPDSQRAGIGTRLLDAFDGAMSLAGALAYRLSVDVSNEKAVTFYEARGFSREGEYREFGANYRRYTRPLEPCTDLPKCP